MVEIFKQNMIHYNRGEPTMLKTASATVEKYSMLNAGDSVIIGLSGGADSVCLLYFLLEKKRELELELFAVHINHGLRGEDADADAQFCAEVCTAVGIEIEIVKANAAEFAKNERLSIEEAGRELRYKAFNDAVTRFNANKIAVAHNADDNAETVLLRLIRGTGIAGLGGIPPVNKKVIRPLIEISRNEIEKHLLDNNISWATDLTNLNNDFTRNKVRNKLIPALNEFNPSIMPTLNRLAGICREENGYIEEIALMAFNRCTDGMVFVGANSVRPPVLDVPSLKNEHPVIQRRVIRMAIAASGITKDVSSVHIERVMGLLNLHTGKQVPVVGGLFAKRFKNKVVFDKT